MIDTIKFDIMQITVTGRQSCFISIFTIQKFNKSVGLIVCKSDQSVMKSMCHGLTLVSSPVTTKTCNIWKFFHQ